MVWDSPSLTQFASKIVPIERNSDGSARVTPEYCDTLHESISDDAPKSSRGVTRPSANSTAIPKNGFCNVARRGGMHCASIVVNRSTAVPKARVCNVACQEGKDGSTTGVERHSLGSDTVSKPRVRNVAHRGRLNSATISSITLSPSNTYIEARVRNFHRGAISSPRTRYHPTVSIAVRNNTR